MIDYRDGYFGVHLLFRVHGSAAYKAASFALLSNGVYLLLYFYGHRLGQPRDGTYYGLKHYDLLDHPYPITVIITAFMFVLSSKVTLSYNRYWEACTALHNMHAKWLDVGSTLAAFHMQSKAYDSIRPPSYGDYQDQVTYNDRLDVQQGETDDSDESNPSGEPRGFISEGAGEADNSTPQAPKKSVLGGFLKIRKKRKAGGKASKAKNTVSIQSASPVQPLPFPKYTTKCYKNAASNRDTVETTKESTRMTLSEAQSLSADPSGDWTEATEHTKFMQFTSRSTENPSAATQQQSLIISEDRNRAVPSLLLQEAAHLLSLLSAVALSTLRCDAEGAEAPLVAFEPGRPWPACNSDDDPDMQKYGHEKNKFRTTVRYLADAPPAGEEGAAYDAARPIPVIDGASERECRMLRRARGASAKTGLAFMWLQEFLERERLRGSFGAVAPPIFSRLPQYLSDGHLWYNSARKMSYMPFPFPHAQMACVFEIVCVLVIPTLMLSKSAAILGFVLNFCTVLLFQGLNELSKELENPFRGAPNDLPLNLFQAHFNEAVATMFAGYHPDSWWEMKGEC